MHLTRFKEHSGVIFGLFLPAQVAQQLHQAVLAAGIPGVESPENYHITLAYLGDAAELEPQLQKLQEFVVFFAGLLAPISGLVGGTGRFNHSEHDGSNAFYASFDSPALGLIRERLVETLAAHDITVASNHGFTPHITLAYIPAAEATPTLVFSPIELVFPELTLAWGDERYQAQLMPAREVTEKAANYSARAGETIAGRLARGGDGKFTAAGSADPEAESKRKPKPKPSSRRGPARRSTSGRKPAAPKKTEQQRQQEADVKRAQRQSERTAEQEKKLQQSRAAVTDGVKDQLQPATTSALLDFNEGKETDPAQLAELAKQGLVEQDKAGGYRLSEAGRAFAAAANRGDVRDAKDALSRGQDRVRGASEQQARSQERAAESAKRRAEVEARRAAAGRGGGKKPAAPKKSELKPEPEKKKPAAAEFKPEQALAAGKLSEGKTLNEVEEGLLVRNGLARWNSNDELILTAAGLRASKQTQKSLSVFKDFTGRWRWVLISSTAFRDRVGETVSTKALEQDVARSDQAGDYGPLRWWHVEGLDIGDCDFRVVDGRSLIESGTFRDERVGKAVALKADDLQASLGFYHGATDPDPEGVFWDIHTFERSLTPRGRACNPFTRLVVKEVSMLTAEKEAAARQLLGDDLLNQLLATTQQTEKAAIAAGVAYKEGEVSPVAEPAIEAKAEGETEVPGDEVIADGADEVLLVGDMTPDEFQAVLVSAFQQALAPLAERLDVETKMRGALDELKSVAATYTTKKDDELASLKESQAAETEQLRTALKEAQAAATKAQQQATAIDARLKTLEGEQPAAARGYRPSQDAGTVIPEGSRLKEGSPEPDPLAPHMTAILGALSQPPQ